jgi:hypothetical protein
LFYAIAYVGFLAPAALAAITPLIPTDMLLLVVTAFAVIGVVLVLVSNRKHLPGTPH